MAFLSSIEIKNFRSCIHTTTKLSEMTPLVGYNNAGKSNILKAIKWLIEGSKLDVKDFYNNSNPVEVVGEIKGLTAGMLALMPENQSNSISAYIEDERLMIKRIQPNKDSKQKDIKIFVKKPSDPASNWRVNPTGLDNAISALFPDVIEIGAMEDVNEDIVKFKVSNTIGKLLNSILTPIHEREKNEFERALDGLKRKFAADGDQRIAEFVEFDRSTTEKLTGLFPGLGIKIHVPLPEIKSIFNSGSLKIVEGSKINEVNDLGHGAQRSIQMALVRHLAEVENSNEHGIGKTLLLIDEPELYLHPQAVEQVREALKLLSQNNYQVLFSTHSAQMVTKRNVSEAVLVRKNETDGTTCLRTIREQVVERIGDYTHQARVLFSLTNSSQILFSEKVILTEGKTEDYLIPELFKKQYRKTLGQEKISLVELGGVANTLKSMEILNTLGLKNAAVVDLDFVFKIALGVLIERTDEKIAACLNFFSTEAARHGFLLDASGLPKKNENYHASDVYELMARQVSLRTHIQGIHEHFLKYNIWVWTKGAIEPHLGLTEKNETEWSNFLTRLEGEANIEFCPDHQSIAGLLTWILA